MGYKMERQSNSGENGLADIKFNSSDVGKRTQVRVAFIPTEKNPEPEIYTISTRNVPGYLKKAASGLYRVRLNGKGDTIFSATPSTGMYLAEFGDIQREEGKPPLPKTFTGSKNGQTWTYEAFTVIHNIVQGKEAGFPVSDFLRYNFEESRTNPGFIAFSHGKSRYTEHLEEFMTVSGVFELKPIPFSDNILPALFKRLKQAREENHVQYMLLLKDGYIDKYIPRFDTGDDLESEDVDGGPVSEAETEGESTTPPWEDDKEDGEEDFE